MKPRSKLTLSTTHIILLGFLFTVLLGSVLLWLPLSSANGTSVSYPDALFTATTSVCVTGLVVLPTATAWSPFGQAVILLLIQIGGLGVFTVLSAVMLILGQKMHTGDRLLIRDAFNLNTLSGLSTFVRRVVLGTLAVELIGALLYMTVFVPRFGLRGIWISVFTAVSAFCNAGMDVIGENSLCDFGTNPLVVAVTCALIVVGGIGYVVWWDVGRILRPRTHGKSRPLRRLTLHSKIALSATGVLIVGGTLLFLIFEYDNPLTLGGRPFSDKLLLSVFQAVTTRTAGFATLPQEHLSGASVAVSLLFMFVGGSPVGTAGGIKTVTLVVLVAAAIATVRNREDTSLFHRRIPKAAVNKAVAVCATSFAILMLSTVLLAAVTDAPLADVLYETASATATVGLSRNLTGQLSLMGKVIVMVTMYLGRVGPISLAVAFGTRRENPNAVKDAVEDISVG